MPANGTAATPADESAESLRLILEADAEVERLTRLHDNAKLHAKTAAEELKEAVARRDGLIRELAHQPLFSPPPPGDAPRPLFDRADRFTAPELTIAQPAIEPAGFSSLDRELAAFCAEKEAEKEESGAVSPGSAPTPAEDVPWLATRDGRPHSHVYARDEADALAILAETFEGQSFAIAGPSDTGRRGILIDHLPVVVRPGTIDERGREPAALPRETSVAPAEDETWKGHSVHRLKANEKVLAQIVHYGVETLGQLDARVKTLEDQDRFAKAVGITSRQAERLFEALDKRIKAARAEPVSPGSAAPNPQAELVNRRIAGRKEEEARGAALYPSEEAPVSRGGAGPDEDEDEDDAEVTLFAVAPSGHKPVYLIPASSLSKAIELAKGQHPALGNGKWHGKVWEAGDHETKVLKLPVIPARALDGNELDIYGPKDRRPDAKGMPTVPGTPMTPPEKPARRRRAHA
jgi:hypothetical protein